MESSRDNIFKDHSFTERKTHYSAGTYTHSLTGRVVEVKKVYGKYIIIKSPSGPVVMGIDYLDSYVFTMKESEMIH